MEKHSLKSKWFSVEKEIKENNLSYYLINQQKQDDIAMPGNRTLKPLEQSKSPKESWKTIQDISTSLITCKT